MANMPEAHDNTTRIVVVGPPRSGTTLLASLLSKLGVDFGLETRDWNINSGYYEHPQLLKIYGQIRKYNRLTQLSDNLAERVRTTAILHLSELLNKVQAIKYPPISAQLPFLMAQAGYKPTLAISARLFEPYAISRMRMEGLGYGACKNDYLETYRTALLLLRVYEGVVVDYEGLIGTQREQALQALATLCAAERQQVEEVVQNSVGEARSRADGFEPDPECLAVYNQLISSHKRCP
jgi:hypothetical protein